MAVSRIRVRLGGMSGAHLSLRLVEPPLVSSTYRSHAVGEITSASLVGDNTLSVTGSLGAEESIRYLSYDRVLFSLDPTETLADLTADTPRLEELSVRQKFDFRVRLDEAARYRKYVVALVDGETVIPLSAPFYAYPAEEDVSSDRIYKGVYADGTVDLFEVGAQTAIVEFDFGRLLRSEEEAANTKLYIVDGVYYHLDVDYMNRIQRAVELSQACGISTVLHLTGIRDVSDTYTSTVALRAFVDFLYEQYGDAGAIRGVILGSEGLDMTSDAYEISGYATMLHYLKLLTSTRLSGITVYGEIDCESNVSQALSQLSAALFREGDLRYGIYLRTDVMNGTAISELTSLISIKNSASPNVYGLLWQVSDREQLSSYSIYASQAELRFETFAVCLSAELDAAFATEQLRSYNAQLEYVEIPTVAALPTEPAGHYALEEFDRNTSTSLWYMGDGVLSFGTGYSTVFSKKALTIHLEEEAHRAFAVYAPHKALDLSLTPYVRISLSLEKDSTVLSDASANASGQITFVSDTQRGVVTLDRIPLDGRVDIYLFLENFDAASKVYAIVLSLEGEVLSEICVEGIELYSPTLSSEEISTAVFHESAASADENDLKLPVLLFLGMLCIITAVVPIALLRKGKDT